MSYVNDVEGFIFDWYMRQQRRRKAMKVVERLRLALLGMGSVTYIAKRLKSSRPNVSNVLNGNRYLSVAMALKIENEFGCFSARELLHSQLDEQITAEISHEKDRSRSHAPAARSARPRRNARVGLLRMGR